MEAVYPMQALFITEPGKTKLGSTEPPELASDGVLLQTRLIGFCGTDLSTYLGKNPLVSYPRIPGHEIAATVLEVGSDVPGHIKPGMDVAVYPGTHCGACASCRAGRTNACKFNQVMGVQRDGALCERFTAHWSKLYAGPGLSLQELCAVEPLSIGFHAVNRARVQPAEFVAVIGCGMVGLAAIHAASQVGANVIAIDVDDAKLRLAQLAGAGLVINSKGEPVHEALLRITSGFGPEVVIEAVGSPETYTLATVEVAHAGRVVYVGWSKEPVRFETKDFVHKELDILGSRNSLSEFPWVIETLSHRTFPLRQAISKVVPLADAADALHDWSLAPSGFNKILVEVSR